MKNTSLLIAFALTALTPAFPQKASPFTGRWDLNVTTPKGNYPSWLEFSEKDGGPQVRVQGRVASVHPVHDLKVHGSHLTFTSSESFGQSIKVTWEFSVAGSKLTGKQHRADGVDGEITGVPAPLLDRAAPAEWSQAESIFNGTNLSGWEADKPSENHWSAKDGMLLNDKGGANIRTARKFDDFKLHIEYNCPEKGNSGVYLRGRYEVQVEYEPTGTNDPFHSMGSIYGFIAPSQVLPKKPGQWESYDITLVGRHVTVVRDDVKIIDNMEIPGITGGALNSDEAQPGPLYLQGDHTGGLKYRNINISVPKR